MTRRRAEMMTGTHESDEYTDEHGIVWRRCVFCGEYKKLTEGYHKNGTGSRGEVQYRLDCKTCYNIRRRENNTKKKHTDFVGSQKRRGEEDIDFSHQEWKEVNIFFGGECAYCGGTPRKGQRLTRDHLEPFSKGGKTTADNIVPACPSCNSSKGDKEWRAWYMAQAFFSQDRMNKIFKWRTILRSIGGGRDD